MQRVNNITQFLAHVAERREKNSTPNIYETIVSNKQLELLKTINPNCDIDGSIQKAVTQFATESFTHLMERFATHQADLLIKIKDQLDAFKENGTPPDIVEIEKLGRECAEEFKLWTDILGAILADIDFEHIAERMIAVGKAAYEERETAKNSFPLN